jgi:hypothetical protein
MLSYCSDVSVPFCLATRVALQIESAPFLCFITANGLNAIVFSAWVALARGLRGSSPEPARPTPEDASDLRLLHIVLASGLGPNLGVPVLFAIR